MHLLLFFLCYHLFFFLAVSLLGLQLQCTELVCFFKEYLEILDTYIIVPTIKHLLS